MIDDSSAERLRDAPLAWLTTVRGNGQPQTSYVWFHHAGADIVVLSEPGARKIRNLRANPRVALNLDGDTATGGGVLTLEATAEVLDELPAERWDAYLAKYESRIRTGPWETPDGFRAVFSAAIRIVPARIRAW